MIPAYYTHLPLLYGLTIIASCTSVDEKAEISTSAAQVPDRVHISPDVHIVHSNPQYSIEVIAGAPLRLNTVYAPLIARAAESHKLEPALVYAVIQAESAFDHAAVSPAGAQGLMQLMPDTAQLLGVSDPFDPAQNINGGTRYLKWLFREFKQQELVLAAYNAGPQAVRKYGRKIPPYRETQRYVEIVKRLYARYKDTQPLSQSSADGYDGWAFLPAGLPGATDQRISVTAIN